MLNREYPTIHFDVLEKEKKLFKDSLEKFGVVVIEESESFQDRTTYFNLLETLFDQLLVYSKPQYFPMTKGFDGIYLPAEVENLVETEEDCKAILDFFPIESYGYKYYFERGFIDSQNLEFDWNEYQQLFLWNQKYLNFLSQAINIVVENELLPDKNRENWLIRFLYYPPVSDEKFLRLAEHIDEDLLTIVISDDYSSLEIKEENNKFRKITVPQNSCLLLAGNCLQHITKSRIKGVSHRVVGGDFYMNSRYVFSIQATVG